MLFLYGIVIAALSIAPSLGQQCRDMCGSCNHLSLFLDTKMCPNCPCMAKLFDMERTQGCDEIDRSVHCPYGLEFDMNGCPTGRCRSVPESCPVNPLEGCNLVCQLGYMTNSNGCPVCECQCDTEGVNMEQVAGKCRDRCHPSRFQITKDSSGCDNCFCEKTGKLAKLCNGIDRTIDCTKNCGRWGYKGGCSGNPCECQCPNPGLTCDHVVCPNNLRPVLKNDTIGCRLACECPAADLTNLRPLVPIKPELCLDDVPCPSDCGQHEHIEVRDDNGCVVRCMCKCKDPGCMLPCINGALTDIYSCPTCQCKIQDQCPLKCNNTCGPYDYIIARDNSGCLSDCSCRCPNEAVCPMGCSNSVIQRDRYGCQRCLCKDSSCGPSCPLECGPHGLKLDMDGCPVCECNCPEQMSCPLCPSGGQQQNYLLDSFGCKTCQCECPPRECSPDQCPQGFLRDMQGCETCQCARPGPRSLDVTCPILDCPGCSSNIRALDNRGCDTCNCCAELACPELHCPLRVNEAGCPICQCAPPMP